MSQIINKSVHYSSVVTSKMLIIYNYNFFNNFAYICSNTSAAVIISVNYSIVMNVFSFL